MRLIASILLTTIFVTGCSSSNPSAEGSNTPLAQADQTTIINAANAEQIVKDAVAVLNLRAISEMQQDVRSLALTIGSGSANVLSGGPEAEGVAFSSSSVIPATDAAPSTTQVNYTCNAAGTLVHLVQALSDSPNLDDEYRFTACNIENTVLNGTLQLSDERRVQSVNTLTDLSIRQGDTEQFLSGKWKIIYGGFENSEEIVWTDARYAASGENVDIRLQNMNWRRFGNNTPWPLSTSQTGFVQDLAGNVRQLAEVSFSAELQSVFSIGNASTKQQLVDVQVNLNFSGNHWQWENSATLSPSKPDYAVSALGTPLSLFDNEEFTGQMFSVNNIEKPDFLWQTGELKISASDGSNVVLTPVADNPRLVSITLNSNESITTRSIDDGFDIERPDVL